MRRSMDKALAALACAILIGTLGALSWQGDHESGLPLRGIISSCPDDGNYKCDEILNEIEKLQSIWRNNDTRASSGEGSQGDS